MFCKKCGKDVPNDSKFCMFCGEVLDESVKKEEKEKEVVIDNTKPLFTASKTAWMYGKKLLTFVGIAILFLAIGILLYIYFGEIEWVKYISYAFGVISLVSFIIVAIYILVAHSNKVVFYKNYVVVKDGIFNTKEKHSALTQIIGVSIVQTFPGKIFNYGDIFLDKIGKWDIDLNNIRKPKQLKKYIEMYIQNDDHKSLRQVISN